jgi:hypothetical protein
MHSVWRGKHECGKVFEILQEQFSGENFTSFYPIEENRNLSVCPKCGKSSFPFSHQILFFFDQ